MPTVDPNRLVGLTARESVWQRGRSSGNRPPNCILDASIAFVHDGGFTRRDRMRRAFAERPDTVWHVLRLVNDDRRRRRSLGGYGDQRLGYPLRARKHAPFE